MVMEYWSGWFDLWGGRHHVYKAEGKTHPVWEYTPTETKMADAVTTSVFKSLK